jgi:GABA(A) receptor-associated protein
MFPDRIPIICEKSKSSSNNTHVIDKTKYLVPNDLTMGQFIYVIRKRLKLNSGIALYLFVDGIIPSANSFLINIYETYKDVDNFLYIYYSFENTFG